jgi:hypothetical protein
MLSRLSVFAGGCSLDAAENVCCGGEIEETLDLLSALVDKSLLIKEGGDDGPRYRMLETVRDYAAARLKGAREPESVRDRHLAYFLDLGERAEPELLRPNQLEWYRALEREPDNLRVALDWSRTAGPEIGLRMVAALWRFSYDRGYIKEGRERVAAALARETDESHTALRANALFGLAGFLCMMGDLEESRRLLEECRAIRANVGDRRGEAQAMMNLSVVAWACGDYALARAHTADSLAFWREDGDRLQLCKCLMRLGVTANEQSDFQSSRAAFDDALHIAEEIGRPYERALVPIHGRISEF